MCVAAKLLCVQCKNRFPRDEMEKINNISYICGLDCKVDYATRKGKEAVKKVIAKIYTTKTGRKKKSARTGKDEKDARVSAAKTACHEYIRLRDCNLPCICCGEPLGDDYHAGHFKESGNNPKIRYDEDNIHGQRMCCNTFKGGDSGMYRVNLINKIGLERVERLESMKMGTVKRTVEDYREIEAYYKDKINSLNKGK